jgi:hypothetical protein
MTFATHICSDPMCDQQRDEDDPPCHGIPLIPPDIYPWMEHPGDCAPGCQTHHMGLYPAFCGECGSDALEDDCETCIYKPQGKMMCDPCARKTLQCRECCITFMKFFCDQHGSQLQKERLDQWPCLLKHPEWRRLNRIAVDVRERNWHQMYNERLRSIQPPRPACICKTLNAPFNLPVELLTQSWRLTKMHTPLTLPYSTKWMAYPQICSKHCISQRKCVCPFPKDFMFRDVRIFDRSMLAMVLAKLGRSC